MKFAEAMEKGSKMVQPVAGKMHDGFMVEIEPGYRTHSHACALGMAEVGARSPWFLSTWGWTNYTYVDLPCECTGHNMMTGGCAITPFLSPKGINLVTAIVHLFNYHVMTAKDWTMDRLLKWVKCVEDHKFYPEDVVEKEEEPVAASAT